MCVVSQLRMCNAFVLLFSLLLSLFVLGVGRFFVGYVDDLGGKGLGLKNLNSNVLLPCVDEYHGRCLLMHSSSMLDGWLCFDIMSGSLGGSIHLHDRVLWPCGGGQVEIGR